MILSIINGPCEGNFMIGIAFMLPLFLGNDMYETKY